MLWPPPPSRKLETSLLCRTGEAWARQCASRIGISPEGQEGGWASQGGAGLTVGSDTSSDSDDDTMVAWVEEESEWTMSQWVTILNVGINGFTSLVLCLISKTVAASCSLFTQWLLCNIIGSIGSSKADLTRWLKGTNSLLICHANHFNNTSHLGISLEFLKHLFPVTLWLVLFWIVH